MEAVCYKNLDQFESSKNEFLALINDLGDKSSQKMDFGDLEEFVDKRGRNVLKVVLKEATQVSHLNSICNCIY
jgi:hypothetical protein